MAVYETIDVNIKVHLEDKGLSTEVLSVLDFTDEEFNEISEILFRVFLRQKGLNEQEVEEALEGGEINEETLHS